MSLREADRKRERIAFLFSLPVAWTVKLKNEMNVTEREKEGEERERERELACQQIVPRQRENEKRRTVERGEDYT